MRVSLDNSTHLSTKESIIILAGWFREISQDLLLSL